MISVVLYGRNDNYGYNLHKRAAISFNCIAEMLNDCDDEILFVDYNTPDDFPTFPEAIRDTLTPRARQLMRIFRVRSHIHERFRTRTHLLALEPVARNIAVRRSHPANRWILSTNTDIVMVPQMADSLSSIVRPLDAGIWQAPRLEIPETLWEGLDRREPRQIIRTIKTWGRSLHLDEIVSADARVLYDGPGDFQLMERSALFDLDGFDEEMLIGWHVDANISVRMALHYGEISDLGDDVFAYHCDHTRQATPAHGHARVQNSIERFVDRVKTPRLPHQRETWGCAQDEIEEVRIDRDYSARYASALSSAIGAPLESPYRAAYAGWSYDKVDYDARHVLPFLTDLFSCAPRSMRVAWWGVRADTLTRFGRVWTELGFAEPVFIAETAPTTPGEARIEAIGSDDIYELCDAFIFDFADCGAPEVGHGLARAVHRSLASEYARMEDPNHTLRRFIGINVIHNKFETFFCSKIGASATPFSTRLRHGFAIPLPKGPIQWLPLLQISRGGERIGNSIRSRPDVVDWVFYGPYKFLPTGRYRACLKFDPDVTLRAHEDRGGGSDGPAAILDIYSRGAILGLHVLRIADLLAGLYELEFDVPALLAEALDFALEIRLRSASSVLICATSLIVERLSALGADAKADVLEETEDWLPFLNLSSVGRWVREGVAAEVGRSGHVVDGPYWRLPAGDYEARLDFSVRPWESDVPGPSLVIEARAEGRNLGLVAIRFEAPGEHSCAMPISIADSEAAAPGFSLTLPVWVSGLADVVLRRLGVSKAVSLPTSSAEDVRMDCLPLMRAGPSGRQRDGAIAMSADDFGFFAEGSHHFGRGRYQVDLEIALAAGRPFDKPAAAIVVTHADGDIAHGVWTAPDLKQAASVAFDLTDASEIRFALWATGLAEGRLRRFEVVRRRGAGEPAASEILEKAQPGGRLLPIVNSSAPEEWMPRLWIAAGGRRVGDLIESRRGVCDGVFYGPYRLLPWGRYVARLEFTGSDAGDPRPAALLEIVHELQPIARKILFAEDLEGRHELAFPLERGASAALVSGPVEVRLRSLAGALFTLETLRVQPTEDGPNMEIDADVVIVPDWLPFLTTGAAGRWRDRCIEAARGVSGHVAYGPYWRLPAGNYEAHLEFSVLPWSSDVPGPSLIVEARAEDRNLGLMAIRFEAPGEHNCAMPISIAEFEAAAPGFNLTLPVWASGLADIVVRRLEVVKAASLPSPSHEDVAMDCLALMRAGASGRQHDGAIFMSANDFGYFAEGSHHFGKGRYRIDSKIVLAAAAGPVDQPAAAIVVMRADGDIAHRVWTAPDLKQAASVAFDLTEAGEVRFAFWATGLAEGSLRRFEVVRRRDAGEPAASAILEKAEPGGRLLPIVYSSAFEEVDWLPRLWVAAGGRRVGELIESRRGVRDGVFYGPYRLLPWDRYIARLGFSSSHAGSAPNPEPAALLEVVHDLEPIARKILFLEDLQGRHELAFPLERGSSAALVSGPVEVRLRSLTGAPFMLETLSVRPAGDAPILEFDADVAIVQDWLPFLTTGAAGRWRDRRIEASRDVSGHVAYGPFWRLPAGNYEVRLDFSVRPWESDVPGPSLIVEARAEDRNLGLMAIRFEAPGEHSCVMPISIADSEAAAPGFSLTLPVWASGLADVVLRRLEVSKAASLPNSSPEDVTMDCLPLMRVGPSSRQRDGAVAMSADDYGFFAEGAHHFGRGRYRVELELALAAAGPVDKPAMAIVVRHADGDIAHGIWTAPDLMQAASVAFDLTEASEVRFALWATGLAEGSLRRFEVVRRRGAGEPAASEILEEAQPGGRLLPIACRTAADGEVDWLPLLWIAPGGRRVGDLIESRQGVRDGVFYGPYRLAPWGRYVARLEFRGSHAGSEPDARPAALLEVVHDLEPIARKILFIEDLEGRHELAFPLERGSSAALVSGPVEVRLRSLIGAQLTLETLSLRPATDASILELDADVAIVPDWLPFLTTGAAGRWRDHCIEAARGVSGHISYGPYWRLPAGDYEVRLDFSVRPWDSDVPGPSLMVEARAEDRHLGLMAIRFGSPGEHICAMPISIADFEAAAPGFSLTLPVWVSGLADVVVRRLEVSKAASLPNASLEDVGMDCLHLMRPGPSGRQRDGAIVMSADDFGFFAEGSHHFGKGRYRVDLEITLAAEAPVDKPAVAMVVTDADGDIAHGVWTASDLNRAASVAFDLTDASEVRFALWATGLAEGSLRRFEVVRRRGAGEPAASELLEKAQPGGRLLPIACATAADGEVDWSPLLWIASGGRRVGDSIESRQGVCDGVFYGPYRLLPWGRYVARLEFRGAHAGSGPNPQPAALLEVVHDLEPIARKILFAEDLEGRHEVAFHLERGSSEALVSGPVEVRLRSLTGLPFALEMLHIRAAGLAPNLEVVPSPGVQQPELQRSGPRALSSLRAAIARRLPRPWSRSK